MPPTLKVILLKPSTTLASIVNSNQWRDAVRSEAQGFRAACVRDGNVITAGGVTSGIDFGLTVAAELAGETAAQTIQLGTEYDPAPPFDSGHPDRAPAAIKSALLSGRYEESRSAFRAGIKSVTRL